MDNRLANLRWERRNTRKRRGVALRGEGHYASKLTEQAVREMRAMAAQARRGGPLTQGDIAAHFGVSQGTASMVIHRKTWKHVP
jgi:DNA-binding MarR family transcriptional regulator